MKSPGGSIRDLGQFPRSIFVIVVCALLSMVIFIQVPLLSVADSPFSANVRVSPNGAGDGIWGGYRLLSTAVAPNGTVYVVWEDARIFPPLDTEIYFSRSIDGGNTFSYEKIISDSPTQKQDLNPVVKVDGRGNVYVVYGTLAWSGGGVRFVKSTDGGETFSSSVRIDDPPGYGGRPDMHIDEEGNINVVYEGGGSPNIHFTKSTDGGITWGDGIDNDNDVQVSDYENWTMQSSPRLAVDLEGNINVAWVDARNVDTRWDTYFSRSTDGGKTFKANIRLNDDPPLENQQSNVDIATGENGEIYVISRTCCSTRNGIYFYMSTDGGLTFNDGIENDNDPMINDRPGAWRTSSIETDASGRISLVYDNGIAIYYTNSSDNGNRFGDGVPNTDPRVQDVSVSGFLPELDVDSCGHVYTFWMDTRNGQNDVYASKLFNLSTDLSVFGYELVFDPSRSIMLGSPVTIRALIHNYCLQFVSQTKVRFFLGEPSTGQQIGLDKVINDLQSQAGFGYANLTWTPTSPGEHLLCAYVDPDDEIVEFDERNNIGCSTVHVALPPIDPPRNLTTEAIGADIKLEWEPPISPYVDHYLIYRSDSQRGFDFGSPDFDTSGAIDPKTTTWIDPMAASPTAPQEYYYVVRASNSTVWLNSSTSNTAGKWTKSFDSGLTAFSLPLEPTLSVNMSHLLENVTNSVYGRWMNAQGHWITYNTGSGDLTNDVELATGRAYEIFLSSPTHHTFCGHPASMITYEEGLSDFETFANSLNVIVMGDDAHLSWNSANGAEEYWIFKAEERGGLHDASLAPIVKLPSLETSWIDVDGLSIGQEYYYMIRPESGSNASFTSTYSVGVVTMTYNRGTDTFALPLDTGPSRTLDYYCNEMMSVIGFAYLEDQEWRFHAKEMPVDVYDTAVIQGLGYQISTSRPARAVFVGI